MRISDLLTFDSIVLDARFQTQAEAIDTLVSLHEKVGNLTDKTLFREAILAREAQGSTAVGDGIAIPHAKSIAVKRAGLTAAVVPNGVACNAADGKPTTLFFMIAAPDDGNFHLEVLSKLMALLMDEEFRVKLLSAKSKADFLAALNRAESEKSRNEAAKVSLSVRGDYRILAVTACPTGIAHTYMAAEALEKAANKLGYPIKVETNGSGGAKNVLTKAEIEAAEGIIIAADKNVEMGRFDGKKLISVKVSDGIRKPEELIKRVLSDDTPVYRHFGEKTNADTDAKEGFGRKIYKHLMNGVSHMLPFVVGGGIFIAIAFLIDTIAGAPQDADFGTATVGAAFFKTVGGIAFNFMIPILSGYIGLSIADRPGLLVGFAGGYLASTGATFTKITGDVSSGFLGALFAGFLGGYLMLGIRRLCDKLPKSLEGIKPLLLYPLIGLGMIAVTMCAINPFMGVLNTGLTEVLHSMGELNKVLLGGILGAMMSIDMGGPFNKAAYVFGTAAITSGNYDIMAAVMVGGMVPPIAIALATVFFPSRFSSEERKSGPVNFIMGAAFITEGAIPFAASDPLRVIPACMLGSGIAGGLSMLFRCTLMAPHGGIFVFAVVGNWPMYLLALAIGSVVGMLLLGLFKRKIKAREGF